MGWTYLATVRSESEPDRSYDIKRGTNGMLGCGCLAFRFKKGEKTCKHLRAYLAGEAVDARPVRQQVRPETVRVKSDNETFTVTRRAISFTDALR